MGVERKPFEIVAECGMVGFPVASDIERISAEIEKARRGIPGIVRAAVVPPAIYREKQYVLQARFLVWANDGADASRAVEGLLDAAAIPCQAVAPTGRALGPRDVPPAPSMRAAAGGKAAAHAGATRAGAASRKSAKKPAARKPAPKKARSKARAAKPARKAARATKRRR
jgi:hypothetical protein